MASDRNEQRATSEPGDMLVGPRPHEQGSAQPVRGFARLLGFHLAEHTSRRGADGERVPGWWLGRLPDGWHVINDVVVAESDANIEHLVIGPRGVFTITTKNLTGKVWVGPTSILHNRRRTDLLPKASAEARLASRFLSSAMGRPVEVRAVLAIVCDDWTVKQRPADVYVDATRGVKDWMLRQPAILRTQEVAELARVASKPRTWVRTARS